MTKITGIIATDLRVGDTILAADRDAAGFLLFDVERLIMLPTAAGAVIQINPDMTRREAGWVYELESADRWRSTLGSTFSNREIRTLLSRGSRTLTVLSEGWEK